MDTTVILNQLADWPVEHAAAAVISPRSSFHYGEQHRRFALASVTKPLVAYAVLIAVEEGALELDEQVGPGGETVEQLLSHTGGVGFASREREKEPGTRRIYSSAGFEILAEAVEAAAEMSFPDYLHAAVLEPLGMNDTTLEGSAGHGATSTVADLEAFAREVLNPTLLHPSTVTRMLTPTGGDVVGVVPGYGMYRPCPWGLGWEIKGAKNPHWTGEHMPEDVAGHFGQAGTFVWVHRPSGQAAVVLTDRPFDQWAKPLWGDFNEQLWRSLAEDNA